MGRGPGAGRPLHKAWPIETIFYGQPLSLERLLSSILHHFHFCLVLRTQCELMDGEGIASNPFEAAAAARRAENKDISQVYYRNTDRITDILKNLVVELKDSAPSCRLLFLAQSPLSKQWLQYSYGFGVEQQQWRLYQRILEHVAEVSTAPTAAVPVVGGAAAAAAAAAGLEPAAFAAAVRALLRTAGDQGIMTQRQVANFDEELIQGLAPQGACSCVCGRVRR